MRVDLMIVRPDGVVCGLMLRFLPTCRLIYLQQASSLLHLETDVYALPLALLQATYDSTGVLIHV